MRLSATGPLVDAAAAWRLVGDSDHLNRMAGNPPLSFEIRPDRSGFPELQGEILGPGPIRHRFVEQDLNWVTGQHFRQVRQIEGPLLRRSHYEAWLAPEGDGVRPTISIDMEPSARWMSGLTRALTERGFQRWVDLVEALPRPGERREEPFLRELAGPTEAALERWRARGAAVGLVDAVARHYRQARASELTELRPFTLARHWGLAPRELLVAFLEGTQVGAMELYWSVRCPRCQGGVTSTDALSNLADHAACPSCRIAFVPDLERSVEVLFAAPATQRPRADQQFCTLYPVGRPDVLAMMILQPGAREEFTLVLPAGACQIGTGGDAPDQRVLVGEVGAAELGATRWSWTAGGSEEPPPLRPGPCTISLYNPGEHRVRVDLSCLRSSDQGVSAALLATMPEYRERFGPQVLAADVRIGVQAVAILFTDLTGSAALYHEHGDAAAFRFVHEHFALLEAAVEAHHGVRVKTIGDALMAAFHAPADAVAASRQMLQAYEAWVATWALTRRPGLKVGIHFGPAMAVHTDGAGLDYFGGTVNLAARAQGKALAGTVVWTAEVQADPEVARLLALWAQEAAAFEAAAFEAEVKGLPEPLTLYRCG